MEFTKETAVEAPKCSFDNFPMSEHEKEIYDIYHMHCFDQNREDAAVSGRFTSVRNQNIAITVRSCRVALEGSENIDEECATQEEITEKATEFAVYVYYRKFYFDSDDVEHREAKSIMKY